MAREAQANIAVAIAVFRFDSESATSPSRALQVLTIGGGLPRTEVRTKETCVDAALRVAAESGVDVGGRRARTSERLTLVGLDDEPGRGSTRTLTAWYYGTGAMAAEAVGQWASVGRSLRLDGGDAPALRRAIDQLRQDTRQVSGAARLLGDVFTGDDLLRVHVALHGGPEGSERTFRRRIQELRDGGALRPVADREVATLRARHPRFRSPAGTGGRPPELFRYGGGGAADEQLVALRARRSA